ncbi:MAG: hypothetical protein RL660_557 [Bacteroidota bacterium]|jgi:hypothetical protein
MMRLLLIILLSVNGLPHVFAQQKANIHNAFAQARWKCVQVHYDSTIIDYDVLKFVKVGNAEDTLKKHPSWSIGRDSLLIRYFEKPDSKNEIVVKRHGPFFTDIAHAFVIDEAEALLTLYVRQGKKKTVAQKFRVSISTDNRFLMLERVKK